MTVASTRRELESSFKGIRKTLKAIGTSQSSIDELRNASVMLHRARKQFPFLDSAGPVEETADDCVQRASSLLLQAIDRFSDQLQQTRAVPNVHAGDLRWAVVDYFIAEAEHKQAGTGHLHPRWAEDRSIGGAFAAADLELLAQAVRLQCCYEYNRGLANVRPLPRFPVAVTEVLADGELGAGFHAQMVSVGSDIGAGRAGLSGCMEDCFAEMAGCYRELTRLALYSELEPLSNELARVKDRLDDWTGKLFEGAGDQA